MMKIGLAIDLNHPNAKKYYNELKPLFDDFEKDGNEVYLICFNTKENYSSHTIAVLDTPFSFIPCINRAKKRKLFSNFDVVKLDVIHILDLSILSKFALQYAVSRCLPLVANINLYDLKKLKKNRKMLTDAQVYHLGMFINKIVEEKGIISRHYLEEEQIYRDLGFDESITKYENKEEVSYVYQRAKRQKL